MSHLFELIRRQALPMAAVMLAVMCGAGAASAGSTPWFDIDDPSGVGDYEMTKDLLTVKCQFKGGSSIADGVPAGYHCSTPDGGACVNAETGPANSCKDIEVQWAWQTGSTPYVDLDDSSGKGDYEVTKDRLKIECRLKNNPKVLITTGKGYYCDLPKGGRCANSETSPTNSCQDMEVRYLW